MQSAAVKDRVHNESDTVRMNDAELYNITIQLRLELLPAYHQSKHVQYLQEEGILAVRLKLTQRKLI